MNITIRTKHFRDSNGYQDIENCPLALALKEHFKHLPIEKIIVGGRDCNIIYDNDFIRSFTFDTEKWLPSVVWSKIDESRRKYRIKPVVLQLKEEK